MKFDKSKVYTSLNADELKVGSEVIVANTIDELKQYVESDCYTDTIDCIMPEYFSDRFNSNNKYYNLAYLISEPIEKIDNIKDECKFAVPRHYIEEYAHMLGKTYWELLDEIKTKIDKKIKVEEILKSKSTKEQIFNSVTIDKSYYEKSCKQQIKLAKEQEKERNKLKPNDELYKMKFDI